MLAAHPRSIGINRKTLTVDDSCPWALDQCTVLEMCFDKWNSVGNPPAAPLACEGGEMRWRVVSDINLWVCGLLYLNTFANCVCVP